MPMRSRWTIAVIGVSAVALGTVSLILAHRRRGQHVEPVAVSALPAVQTAAVRMGTITQRVALTGTVQARYEVGVAPETSGQIQALYVHTGQRVGTGQLLAQLDPDTAEAQLRAAAASAAMARDKLAELLAGPVSGSVSGARAALDAAQVRYLQLLAGPTPAQLLQAQSSVRAARVLEVQAQAQAAAAASPQGPAGVAVAKAGQELMSTEYAGTLGQPALPAASAAAAAAAVAQAQSALAAAQAAQAQTEQQAATALAQAQNQVATAEANLAALRAPATALQVRAARDAVAQARGQWQEAVAEVSPDAVAAARAALAQAEAQAQTAELQLAATHVTAPFAGTVTERLVAPGANVTPETPICTLIGQTLLVNAPVPQSAAATIRAGQAVVLRPLGGAAAFAGRVIRVQPTVDATTLTMEVVILPDAAAQRALAVGEAVEASVTTAETPSALLVPQAAVQQTAGTGQVFVVTHGRVTLSTVRLGPASGGEVEVLAGLSRGQRVVVSGETYLAPGDQVRASA